MGLESLSEAIERLGARGYAHSLRAHDGALRDLETGDLLEPEKLTIEEIVRFVSPVIWMRRTATRDTELNGHEIKEGEKLVLYYNSANRDEKVFTDPDKFDITRSPNPHVGFGGPGPHFCLGAHLARQEINAMFQRLFTEFPNIKAGTPDRLFSNFINGIKHLPYTLD